MESEIIPNDIKLDAATFDDTGKTIQEGVPVECTKDTTARETMDLSIIGQSNGILGDAKPVEQRKSSIVTIRDNPTMQDAKRDMTGLIDKATDFSLNLGKRLASVNNNLNLRKKIGNISTNGIGSNGATPRADSTERPDEEVVESPVHEKSTEVGNLIEIQRLDNVAIQRIFALPTLEKIILSYSCAMYQGNFPCHGRLYLLQSRACFVGWRDTKMLLLYSEMRTVEKKNTARLVPNAIEIGTSKGEKHLLTSFIYREHCFHVLLQINQIFKTQDSLPENFAEIAQKMSTTSDISSASLTPNVGGPCTSTKNYLDESDISKSQHSDSISSIQEAASKEEAANSSPKRRASAGPSANDSRSSIDALTLANNPLLLHAEASLGIIGKELPEDYEKLVDVTMQASTSEIFSKIWDNPSFLNYFLKLLGETDIIIESWKPKTGFNLKQGKNCDRTVTFKHNKKYIVGPSCVPTKQVQELIYDELNGRLKILITSTISEAPLCDCFHVESQWLFIPINKESSTAKFGAKVVFVKNTWLKKQIISNTISESKETTKKMQEFMVNWIKQKPGTSPPALPLVSNTVTPQAKKTDSLELLGTIAKCLLFILMVPFRIFKLLISGREGTLQYLAFVVVLGFSIMVYYTLSAFRDMTKTLESATLHQREQQEMLVKIYQLLQHQAENK